ncbi:hypothetical protein K439DRAFT_1657189 [Ramaria rubella]|nr:hypothetical protein K439DRAFT_1657189 [Ramaria rubella]
MWGGLRESAIPLSLLGTTSMSGPGEAVSVLVVALEVTRAAVFCNIASYAMLLYDYLLTLESEIQYIWPAPWSLGKVMYFCTRYPGLADGALLTYLHTAPRSITNQECSNIYKATGWMIMGGVLIAEFVLIFRTWAIFGKNKILAIMLLVFGCLLIIPAVVFEYKGLDETQFVHLRTLSTTCWEINSPGAILFVDYIFIAVFESLILVLTVYKGVQHLRYNRSNLVFTLYRDGVLFYVYLIGFSLVNIILLVLGPKPGPNLMLMQRALHSILTARLLLNLREAAARDQQALPSPSRDRSNNDTDAAYSRAGAGMWGDMGEGTALSSVVWGADSWLRDGLV